MLPVVFVASLVHRLVHHAEHRNHARSHGADDERGGEHEEDHVQDARVVESDARHHHVRVPMLGDEAQQLAGGLIASQLEKTLGPALGLDTIDITAGSQLGSGSVRLGRYVTQDLFLSLEQGFGQAGSTTTSSASEASVFISQHNTTKTVMFFATS